MTIRELPCTDNDQLLSAKDLVALTGFCRSQIYSMIARGELVGIRSGRGVRVSMAAYRRWLAHANDATTSTTESVDAMAARLKRARRG